MVQFCVKSRSNDFFVCVEALCVPTICSPISKQDIKSSQQKHGHLSHHELAHYSDEQSYLSIHILDWSRLLLFIHFGKGGSGRSWSNCVRVMFGLGFAWL